MGLWYVTIIKDSNRSRLISQHSLTILKTYEFHSSEISIRYFKAHMLEKSSKTKNNWLRPYSHETF